MVRVQNAAMVLPDDARVSFLAAFLADPKSFYALLDTVNAFSDAHGESLRLVDKRHELSPDYQPADLVSLDASGLAVSKPRMLLAQAAVDALQDMLTAARQDGIRLEIGSAFRSYEYQAGLFERNVQRFGLAETERFSARPGQSQHQLGTAVDFAPIDESFGPSAAGMWVQANAARFGFSQSFPADMEAVTGYMEESWHWRWLGSDALMLQRSYFMDVQQYMLEFLHAWKQAG